MPAEYDDLNPANLKPGMTTPDGSDLKPGLVKGSYGGGTPASPDDLSRGLRDMRDGKGGQQLKAGLSFGDSLKAGLLKVGGALSLQDQMLAMSPQNYFPMASADDWDGSLNLIDATGNMSPNLRYVLVDNGGANAVPPTLVTDGSGPTQAPGGYLNKVGDQRISRATDDGPYWRSDLTDGTRFDFPTLDVDDTGLTLAGFFNSNTVPITASSRCSIPFCLAKTNSPYLSFYWSGYGTTHPHQNLRGRAGPGSGDSYYYNWQGEGIVLNTWHHYILRRFRRSGSYFMDIHIDGSFVGETAVTGSWSGETGCSLEIGGSLLVTSTTSGPGAQITNGKTCHVGFWTRKVDISEFTFLA